MCLYKARTWLYHYVSLLLFPCFDCVVISCLQALLCMCSCLFAFALLCAVLLCCFALLYLVFCYVCLWGSAIAVSLHICLQQHLSLWGRYIAENVSLDLCFLSFCWVRLGIGCFVLGCILVLSKRFVGCPFFCFGDKFEDE